MVSGDGRSNHELLRAYAGGERGAMDVLVRRHVDLVYGSALRRLGDDAGAAADATQEVFQLLCRKAGGLKAGVVLEGWLFKTTRWVVRNMQRSQRRRETHERRAAMGRPEREEAAAAWEAARPGLDEAIAKLGEKDRQAVLLRYFRQMDFAQVAAAIGASEAATRKRVTRALEKLRGHLARSGVRVGEGMVGSMLALGAVEVAPVGVAAKVSAGAAGIAVAKGWLGVVGMTKAKAAAVLGAVVAATAGVAIVAAQVRKDSPKPAPVQQVADAVGAETLGKWREEFDRVYGLEEEAVLKRVAPPYPPERMAWYRATNASQAQSIPRGPDWMSFRWKDGKADNWSMTFGGPPTLRELLSLLMGLRSYEYEGDSAALALVMPGDWVVRESAPMEAKLAALAEMASATAKKGIRIEKAKVRRPVVVAKGEYRFTPLEGAYSATAVHFYSGKLDKDEGSGGGGGTVRDLLGNLGDRLIVPVTDETTGGGPEFVQWAYHSSSRPKGGGVKLPREKMQEVLDGVARQTGLKFEWEEREVEVWRVTAGERP